jgi:formylmethanofuran dehydrogenase subunit D
MGRVEPPPEELDSIAEPGTPESRTEWMSKALELVAGPASRGIDAETQVISWAYRTIGRRMPAPSLVAIWALCHANANGRRDDVLRVLGQHWGDRPVSELGEELFRLVLENPGGVEIARLNPDDNLAAHIGYADGRVRLSPEAMMGELERAIDEAPAGDDGEFPLILGNGLRTRWTANTIQRSPDWRKGRGPHCMLTINPEDAKRLGIADGQNVRLSTSRGSAELPAAVDVKMRPGHVAMPNGFGMQYDTDGGTETLGVNMNELTDTRDRDPFTGCPHHRHVRCKVEPAAQAA